MSDPNFFNFNDAGKQKNFHVVPDNTICTVQLNVRPGGAGLDGWPMNPNRDLRPISRLPSTAFNDVEQAIEADRRYFAEHPNQDEYIREFCPGEFGNAELQNIPPGFRYATVVTVFHRTDGVADGRHRSLIAVSNKEDLAD